MALKILWNIYRIQEYEFYYWLVVVAVEFALWNSFNKLWINLFTFNFSKFSDTIGFKIFINAWATQKPKKIPNQK